MEVDHTNNIRVSPKIVEIHTNNFSSWCHMFHVFAVRPGTSKIQFNFGNSSLRYDYNKIFKYKYKFVNRGNIIKHIIYIIKSTLFKKISLVVKR